MSERDEQIKLFQWIRLHPNIKPYALFIPNDGKRSPLLGAIYKRMGLRPGTSDIFIAIPNKTHHGLWIELKWRKNKATPAQLEFIEDMTRQGYAAHVIWGADDAIKQIEQYLLD
jgi:hypothetical protein